MGKYIARYEPRMPKYDYKQVFKIFVGLVTFVVTIFAIYVAIMKQEIPPNQPQKFLMNFKKYSKPESICKAEENFQFTPKHLLTIKRHPFPKCQNVNKPLLISVITTTVESSPILLKVNQEVVKSYKKEEQVGVNCCVREVSRSNDDNSIELTSECENFDESKIIPDTVRNIYVSCKSKTFGDVIYENVHSIFEIRKNYVDREKRTNILKKSPYNVLIFGMNSFSRMNFQRGFSRSYANITNSPEYFEMKGYTRISHESFPNNFALLTGLSASQRYMSCDPRSNDFLDNCRFIWKAYENAGYITLFGEDQTNKSAFNYRHKGFNQEPTDQYFRPFYLAIDKFLHPKVMSKEKDDIVYCADGSIYIDYIVMNTNKVIALSNENPFFAVFMTNSLRNRQLSTGKVMDDRLTSNLFHILEEKSENDTIIIYVSDSGEKFESGILGLVEERNPMLIIRLPMSFQEKFPYFAKSLRQNQNKPTSPYDLHVTLRHILKISTNDKIRLKAPGCPLCKSLFTEISNTRKCAEMGITAGSCPCNFETISNLLPVAKKLTADTLKVINEKIGDKCVKFKVLDAQIYKQKTSSRTLIYIVNLKLSPGHREYEVMWERKSFQSFKFVKDSRAESEFCIPISNIPRRTADVNFEYDEE